MSFQSLVGTPKQYAGAAGTVTLNSGECLLFVSAWASSASATAVILGGPSITIPQSTSTNPVGIWSWWIEHTLLVASASVNTIVFTNTAHYFVHTVHQGHGAA